MRQIVTPPTDGLGGEFLKAALGRRVAASWHRAVGGLLNTPRSIREWLSDASRLKTATSRTKLSML
ncbi:MAG TPA: hypothetical protein VJV03_15505 [Pyrinomonadaceae bacterium]|nr:hypothetical protein [Pyrinomonadaceae bacterium]